MNTTPDPTPPAQEGLLPCPFCGHEANFGCLGPCLVRCMNESRPHCPAAFGGVSVETWNHRAPSPTSAQPTPGAVAQSPLLGEWRHANGYLINGTMRIARADFDTDPNAEFRVELFDWICDTLNRPAPSLPAMGEVALYTCVKCGISYRDPDALGMPWKCECGGTLSSAPLAGDAQGLCATTLTQRFANPQCKCKTYEGNLGPCATFAAGANGQCAYCDHAKECHVSGDAHKAEADTARLDWLLDYITQNGANGLADIPWTVVEEDEGDAMLDRADAVFDRAAIDSARAVGQEGGK